jgi:hypothetical protein
MISNDPVFFCNKCFWMNRLFFENHIWVLIPNLSFSKVDSFARMSFLIEWKKNKIQHNLLPFYFCYLCYSFC